jgi:hypothetical protein
MLVGSTACGGLDVACLGRYLRTLLVIPFGFGALPLLILMRAFRTSKELVNAGSLMRSTPRPWREDGVSTPGGKVLQHPPRRECHCVSKSVRAASAMQRPFWSSVCLRLTRILQTTVRKLTFATSEPRASDTVKCGVRGR